MARLLGPKSRFKYIPSFATDIRKTMKRERKRLQREKEGSNNISSIVIKSQRQAR